MRRVKTDGTSPYIVVGRLFRHSMEEELDIDTGINIAISNFGTAPTSMFSSETVRDPLKGPVRGQTTAKAVSTQIPRIKASSSTPGFEAGKKLGIGDHTVEAGKSHSIVESESNGNILKGKEG